MKSSYIIAKTYKSDTSILPYLLLNKKKAVLVSFLIPSGFSQSCVALRVRLTLLQSMFVHTCCLLRRQDKANVNMLQLNGSQGETTSYQEFTFIAYMFHSSPANLQFQIMSSPLHDLTVLVTVKLYRYQTKPLHIPANSQCLLLIF